VSNPRGWNLDEFMRTLRYERDIRQDLESRRRSEFRKGWGKGSDGEGMTPRTLKSLTWHNLGYRAGKHFGPASDHDIQALLDELEVLYHRTKTGSR